MVPMEYGEVIAMRLEEARREAARVRRARAARLPRTSLRVRLAGRLVDAANRLGGCEFIAEVVQPARVRLAS